MICQRFRTDWEKCLPSGEYGVTIGRTLLGLAVLGGLWRRVSQEWRCSPHAPGFSRSNPHDINHGR